MKTIKTTFNSILAQAMHEIGVVETYDETIQLMETATVASISNLSKLLDLINTHYPEHTRTIANLTSFIEEHTPATAETNPGEDDKFKFSPDFKWNFIEGLGKTPISPMSPDVIFAANVHQGQSLDELLDTLKEMSVQQRPTSTDASGMQMLDYPSRFTTHPARMRMLSKLYDVEARLYPNRKAHAEAKSTITSLSVADLLEIVGEKTLTSKNGNKGIIVKVMPDNSTPVAAIGTPAEVIGSARANITEVVNPIQQIKELDIEEVIATVRAEMAKKVIKEQTQTPKVQVMGHTKLNFIDRVSWVPNSMKEIIDPAVKNNVIFDTIFGLEQFPNCVHGSNMATVISNDIADILSKARPARAFKNVFESRTTYACGHTNVTIHLKQDSDFVVAYIVEEDESLRHICNFGYL